MTCTLAPNIAGALLKEVDIGAPLTEGAPIRPQSVTLPPTSRILVTMEAEFIPPESMAIRRSTKPRFAIPHQQRPGGTEWVRCFSVPPPNMLFSKRAQLHLMNHPQNNTVR